MLLEKIQSHGPAAGRSAAIARQLTSGKAARPFAHIGREPSATSNAPPPRQQATGERLRDRPSISRA